MLDDIDALKAKLRAREGQPGWAENCRDIKFRIAELEAAASADSQPQEE